jgi:ribonucleotide monophosphatase NagD (HAD superfamily)
VAQDELGFKQAYTVRQLLASTPDLSPYHKMLPYAGTDCDDDAASECNIVPSDIAAIFIIHDPIEWASELQVCLDVLLADTYTQQVPLFTSNSDFTYSATYRLPRFAQGSFHICLSELYNRTAGQRAMADAKEHAPKLSQTPFGEFVCYLLMVTTTCLMFTTYIGKPEAVQFQYAGKVLASEVSRLRGVHDVFAGFEDSFDTVVMIGDNPTADIRGANNAGERWESALVRTGVFTGRGNDPADPADFVYDNVADAVHSILERDL